MNLTVHPKAEMELWDSVIHYEEQQAGLGMEFADAADEALIWISENPESLRLRAGFYRRFNMDRFTHYIAYVIRSDEIRVLSISHSHRKPEHWLGRLEH